MIRLRARVFAFLCLLTAVAPAARAETPEEWIALGARVHGGFGAFIPVGIRIGLDALQRLNAKPREVRVVYYDSDKAPCACVADGVAIATVASPGQRTLMMATEKPPVGAMAVVVVRKKQSEEGFRYTLADSWLPKLAEWNQTLDARGRYDAVMQAEGLGSAACVGAIGRAVSASSIGAFMGRPLDDPSSCIVTDEASVSEPVKTASRRPRAKG